MAWTRIEAGSNLEQKPQGGSDGLGLVVVAVGVAGLLAMVATWLLASYWPVPDDEAISVGLIGFFFVVFLDIFLIYHWAVPAVRRGAGVEAVKMSVSLGLLGLLVASVVGALPWLLSRLLAALPWMQEIPGVSLLLFGLVAQDLWKRRKETGDDEVRSWVGLILKESALILLIASTLVSAFFGFSGGKAWLGALHLALALLSGYLAVVTFMEILKGWKRRREGGAREAR